MSRGPSSTGYLRKAQGLHFRLGGPRQSRITCQTTRPDANGLGGAGGIGGGISAARSSATADGKRSW